jgi:hypothetical protein
MKGEILRLAAIALVTSAVGCRQAPVVLNQDQFVEALRSNWISEFYIMYKPTETNWHEVRGQMRNDGQTADVQFIAKLHVTDKLAEEMLASERCMMK